MTAPFEWPNYDLCASLCQWASTLPLDLPLSATEFSSWASPAVISRIAVWTVNHVVGGSKGIEPALLATLDLPTCLFILSSTVPDPRLVLPPPRAIEQIAAAVALSVRTWCAECVRTPVSGNVGCCDQRLRTRLVVMAPLPAV
jgi:hypothetical protein